MRKYWKEILLALVLGLALPWAVAAAGMKSPVPATEITATETMETTAAHMEATDRTLKVLQEGQVTEMDLDEYLTGVLLGEIPADFEPETKKAQAVVVVEHLAIVLTAVVRDTLLRVLQVPPV